MAEPRARFLAAALRWRRHELDAARTLLAALEQAAAAHAHAHQHVAQTLARELAGRDGQLLAPFDAYRHAQQAQLATIAKQSATLAAEIDTARAAVHAAFERCKPLERTAEALAALTRATRAAAAQAELDDCTATGHARAPNGLFSLR